MKKNIIPIVSAGLISLSSTALAEAEINKPNKKADLEIISVKNAIENAGINAETTIVETVEIQAEGNLDIALKELQTKLAKKGLSAKQLKDLTVVLESQIKDTVKDAKKDASEKSKTLTND